MAHKLEKLYLTSPIFMQNLMMTAYGLKIYYERFGKRFENWIKFFEESEKWSLNEQEAFQNEKLRELK